MITDASSALYTATRKRSFIQSVSIVIPQSWQSIEANSSTWESFDVNSQLFKNFISSSRIDIGILGCGCANRFTELALW